MAVYVLGLLMEHGWQWNTIKWYLWNAAGGLKAVLIAFIVVFLFEVLFLAPPSLQGDNRNALETRITELTDRAVKAEAERNSSRVQADSYMKRIGELQLALAQKAPIIVPAPAVNVFTGNGQGQAFNLSADNASVLWTSLKEWTRTRSAFEIPISWDDLTAFDAYADFTLYAGGFNSSWGQARIWDLTAQSSAVETPQINTGRDGKMFHLMLPRRTGLHRYVLQLRCEPSTDADVNAIGQIVVVKRLNEQEP